MAYLIFNESLIISFAINIDTDSPVAFKLCVKRVDPVFYLYYSVCKNTINAECLVNLDIHQYFNWQSVCLLGDCWSPICMMGLVLHGKKTFQFMGCFSDIVLNID